MADVNKHLKIRKGSAGGFGFSILGGSGTDLPPIVYDIIDASPASKCGQLVPGDIILEVNGEEVHSLTTKEVLNCLRLSPSEVSLKLKSDPVLQAKVKHLFSSSTDAESLRSAITQNDLLGVKHIYAKKSDANQTKQPKSKQPNLSSQVTSSSDMDSEGQENGQSSLPRKSNKNDSALPKGPSKANVGSPPMSEDESDIDSLHSFHYNPKAVDIPSAVRLAKRLFVLDGFKKSDVSRHLSRNNEFNKVVAEEYLSHFTFEKDTLDIALRKFLDKFCLAGETQERERVLVHFSKRFLDCNPSTFNSQDAVHTLTCAIMLLNTDLHSTNVGRKMTAAEFTENLAELNDGENFPKEVLKALYQSIKSEPLKWAIDEEKEESSVDCLKSLKNHSLSLNANIGGNPFLSAPSGAGVIYKKGYVMRKCCLDPQGKKTPFGKRSWKMWFCIIQDLVLYLHKDEQGAKREPLPQIGQNAVRLHHALAVRANDYAKKEHVFRLETADQAEYLLQTSDSKELQVWIDSINFVAASLSAPPMAGAVGSQKKFQRPLLPCSITKLNLVDQLGDQTSRLMAFEESLLDHIKTPPEKTAKASFVANYNEKEAYLIREAKRYTAYVYLLKSKLESEETPPCVTNIEMTELPVFEARKTGANGQASESSVVPPPIPSRPRRTDSNPDGADAEECPAKTKVHPVKSASNPDLSKTCTDDATVPKKESKPRKRRNSSVGDYDRELDKLLKLKAKRDKKLQVKEAKAERSKQKQILKGQKRPPSLQKDEPDPQPTPKEADKFVEDPRVGTFNRMSALFSFKRLNRSEVGSSEPEGEQPLPSVKPASTNPFEGEDDDEKPPPLPPKPPADSLVRRPIGGRMDI